MERFALEVFNSTKDLRDRGYAMKDPPLTLIAYDPAGDGADNDAVVIVAREEWRRGELHDPDLAMEFIFRIHLAQRLPKDWEFPEKLAGILNLNKLALRWQRQGKQYAHVIGVETNGVGYAMASSLRKKTQAPIIGYTTVANSTDTAFKGNNISMPRLAALDNLRVQTELHKVKVAKDAIGGRDLASEMNAFVWAGKNRPEAMKGEHDDLVMACAGALWIGCKLIPPVTKQMKLDPKRGLHRAPQGSMRLN